MIDCDIIYKASEERLDLVVILIIILFFIAVISTVRLSFIIVILVVILMMKRYIIAFSFDVIMNDGVLFVWLVEVSCCFSYYF